MRAGERVENTVVAGLLGQYMGTSCQAVGGGGRGVVAKAHLPDTV